jgi:glutamate:GABA antiporter
MPEHSEPYRLRRVMGFRDLLLFYIVTGFSLRWIASSAAAGPSAIAIWLMGCAAFYVPLVLCVLELSSRYPAEGGVYVWSKQAFGDFAGFITGWMYWACNLPYFPALFYFTAANALFIGGAGWQSLANDRLYFMAFSLLGLALAAGLNIVGLNVGKWLHNAGAVGLWLPTVILLVMGGLAWARFGSATAFTGASLVPSTRLKDILFWSTIAFSLSGVESASLMGAEIRDARRSIPRALLIAVPVITCMYILATVSVMLALPHGAVLNMQGIMQAITKVGDRLGVAGIVSLTATLITISGIGQAGAWFAACGRLPFVAGVDRLLPAAFGRVHRRWGTPHVALLVYALVAAAFIFLSQAGTSVQGAYDVLVSMTIIAYFIPYLFMFAAMIRLQREPVAADVIRVPGGKRVAILAATVGLMSTTLSIALSVLPSPGEPNPTLAVVKIVGLTLLLVAFGAGLYFLGRVRSSGRGSLPVATTSPNAVERPLEPRIHAD